MRITKEEAFVLSEALREAKHDLANNLISPEDHKFVRNYLERFSKRLEKESHDKRRETTQAFTGISDYLMSLARKEAAHE